MKNLFTLLFFVLFAKNIFAQCTVSITSLSLTSNGNISVTAAGTGLTTPTYAWTWGDGSLPTNGQTASHLYTRDSSFNVCVRYFSTSNPLACGTSIIQSCSTVVVTGTQPAIPCTVTITGVSMSNGSVNVTANSTTPNPVYGWTWGDNSTPSQGSAASHTYTRDTTFNICVNFSSTSQNCGFAPIQVCTSVVVTGSTPPPPCEATISTPSVAPNTGNVSVTLTGTGASVPGYAMNWGDQTLPSANASGSFTHTYAASGVYQICGVYTNTLSPQTCNDTVCTNVTISLPTTVAEVISQTPTQLSVQPNPFKNRLEIKYTLAQTADVELSVFDVLGNKVQTLQTATQNAGEYQTAWEASTAATGIYFLRLWDGRQVQTFRIIKE